MKNMVSVIVPVYNCESFLKKCISSIINQSYTDLEIILVDDGSTDNSGMICDSFREKDSRIRVIHKENGGVSAARNAGIAEASGEFICFVDSDDWLPNNSIEILVKRAYEDNSDFCVGAYKNVGIRKTDIRSIPDKTVNIEQVYDILQFRFAFKSPWAKLFRTSIIHQNQLGFILDIPFGEDTIFVWSYLSYCQKISMISSLLYYYSLLNTSNACGKYYPDFVSWQYIYIDKLAKNIYRSNLTASENRFLVCHTVLEEFAYWGEVYAQHLYNHNNYELIERLHYTVQLFRCFLFDDSLINYKEKDPKLKTVKEYIVQNNYKELSVYFVQNSIKKRNILSKIIYSILLLIKKVYVYSF